MRRRDFIKVVAGSVAAWPLAAHAQQPGKVPRIGFLGAASPSTFAPRLEAFRLGLRDFGYVEGVNITIDGRRSVARRGISRCNCRWPRVAFASAVVGDANYTSGRNVRGYGRGRACGFLRAAGWQHYGD
jgi:hypothetical protein